jgi:pimeloyl-ACP methyl ester carboxylesterase
MMSIIPARFQSGLIFGVLAMFCPAFAAADVPARSVAPIQSFNSDVLRVERFGMPGKVPLIFIPALYCGAWQWNGQVSVLAKRYDIYVVTLPGFDGLPRTSPDHLVQRTVNSLLLLIKRDRLVKPIIIGHSLGGTIAVIFGEMHPDEAGGIIAVEGGHPVAATAAARAAYAKDAAAPYRDATAASFVQALESSLRYLITRKRDVDKVVTLAERDDPLAIADWFEAALPLDLTPGLARITIPFVEIVPYDRDVDAYRGFSTRAAKQRTYAAWMSRAPGSVGVVMIAPSRHFVMFDQPLAFNRALSAEVERMDVDRAR